MRELTPVEQGNIQLALNNLNSLIESARRFQDALEVANDDLERLEHIAENLEQKLGDGDIKPVEGLNDEDGKSKYRHWDGERWREGHPTGAYCDNHTQVWNDEEERWENCEAGDIILDADLIDPPRVDEDDRNPDGTLNPATKNGWKAKWRLLHVMVHEKMHEILIGEQIELLQLGDWVPPIGDPGVSVTIAIGEATRKGATPEMHGQVYMVQKALLELRSQALEEELNEMRHERERVREQRRQRRRDLRSARTADPPDPARIAELEGELEELGERDRQLLDDINKKIVENEWKRRWLDDQHDALQRDMQKAVRSTARTDHRHCSSMYGDLKTGNVAIAVTDSSGYERFDLKIREGAVTDLRISDTDYYGVYRPFGPVIDQPDLFIEMSGQTYTGLVVQPNPCAFVDWAVSNGRIVSKSRPFGSFAKEERVNALDAIYAVMTELHVKLEMMTEEIEALKDEMAKRCNDGRNSGSKREQ
jgi:hypothetical protein